MRRRRHGCKKLGKCCLYILGRNIVAQSQLLTLLEYVASKEDPVLLFLNYGLGKIDSKQHANIKKEGKPQF